MPNLLEEVQRVVASSRGRLDIPMAESVTHEQSRDIMLSSYRVVASTVVLVITTFFLFKPKNTYGAGRIRTSDLQRPRLASFQARQRPQNCTVSGCNPYYMSINMRGWDCLGTLTF